MTRNERFILLALVIAGILSIFRFGEWWFRGEHVESLPFYLILTLCFWYSILRMILMWINALGIRKPQSIRALPGKRVAIFTTSSPGEPLSMFEKTLEACTRIRYPHTTYLLDDTEDPRFKEVAERHGAVWLELVGLPGAKAGKINKALEMTDEEFILVLDPDHIPFPNFMDEVLGYFEEENVGFVQVAQAYYNQYRSFTAKGAAEQTYSFYGPMMMGLYGYGCNLAIGANCTFRRDALASSGGHGIGLAEDMITAIRLHAKGWKSVYVPKVLSRGLVPEDFGSFCKQQLKWSRGVHDILFVELPKLWKELTWKQRLAYLTISTYYLGGFVLLIYILIPYVFFLTDLMPANMYFSDFIVYGAPVVFFGLWIYLYLQRWVCDRKTERGIHWRGSILKFSTWAVFLYGSILAVFNARIPYIPTAKEAVTGRLTRFVLPLILHWIVFIFTLVFVIIYRAVWLPEASLELTSERTWGMLFFAFAALFLVSGGIFAALQSRKLRPEQPWSHIDIEKLSKLRKK